MPALHCLLVNSFHPDAHFDVMLQSSMQVLMSMKQVHVLACSNLFTEQAS
jgi:hypothetical protein